MRPSLLLLSTSLALLVPLHAFAAPIVISPSSAAAPPRSTAGIGVCATAVHLDADNLLTSLSVAEAELAQAAGTGAVDGKVTFSYSTIDVRSIDPNSVGDYSDNHPLPFSALPGSAAPGNDSDVAMRLRGYLNITRAGTYTLAILSDGGYQLLLGGTPVLATDAAASLRDSQAVTFSATGMYPLQLIYFHNTGPATLELSESDQLDVQGTNIPTPLGPTFGLVPQSQLFTALVGQSTCTECSSDSSCTSASGAYCRDGLCQPCLVAARCGPSCQPCAATAPLCLSSGKCVECSSGDTHICDAKAQLCDLNTNTCVSCIADADCGSGKICDTAFGQCIPRPDIQYGGGCSSTGANPGGAETAGLLGLLLCLGLALVRPFRRAARTRLWAGLILALGGVPASAQAQSTGTGSTSPTQSQSGASTQGQTLQFNAQTFRPVLGPDNLFTLDGTRITQRTFMGIGGIFAEYANAPIRGVISGTGQVYDTPVPAQVTIHLMPGIAVARRFALVLDVPLVVYQPFDSRTPTSDVPSTPGSAGVGDVKVLAKLRLVNNDHGGIGLAFAPQFTLPTGSVASFRSDGTFGIEPRLALDYRFSRGSFIALNLGYYARTYNREVDFGLTQVSDLVRYGIGGSVALPKGLSLAGEISGAVSISHLTGGPLYSPVEGLLGARYTHRSGFEATLGGGGAFVSAVGTPNFRLFLSLGYVPRGKPAPKVAPVQVVVPVVNPDADGDGVIGAADHCPNQPGPAENQGCPDTDEDQDGVVDRLDKCPKEAGPADNQGCPEPDEDQDGVVDRLDKCPKEAGPADNDGCPKKDEAQIARESCADKAGLSGDECAVLTIQLAEGAEPGGNAVLTLQKPIKFAPGTPKIDRDSVKSIVTLSKLIAADATIKKAVIIVTASGDKKAARKLAGQRAKVLTTALVNTGSSKKVLLIKAAAVPSDNEDVVRVGLLRGAAKAVKAPKAAKAPKAKKEKKAKKSKKKKKAADE